MNKTIPEEHVFWLKGGKAIKNLAELVTHLETMDDETFQHHVNKHKNDFATWVRHALKEEKLAFTLESATTPEHMAKHVNNHLIKPVIKPTRSEKRAEVKQKEPEPTIIRTPHVTKLHLAHKPERILTPRTTQLHLSHHPSNHSSTILTASYIAFGVVVGTALTIFLLAL